MSTTKPRITVMLEPHAHEVLSRLSAASGDSMSKIVAGFVDLAIPSLERVVLVMEQAKAAPEEVRSGLRASIDRAEREFMPMATAAISQADLFLTQVAQDLGAGTAPAPKAKPGAGAVPRRAVRTPGLVTRGSGGAKAPAGGPAKGGKNGSL